MRPSIKSRMISHFKKWWWAHCIALVAVVLVVALPLIYVLYPKIARAGINDSTLDITSMVISNPTPGSFHLKAKQIIGTKSSFHPTIHGFKAQVSRPEAASAFAALQIPGLKARDNATVSVDQRLYPTDQEEFETLVTDFMIKNVVPLHVHGKPALREGGLPKITVTYDKTVHLKGFNRLRGFKLLDLHMTKFEARRINVEGEVLIPNASVITISLGNITMDLSAYGTAIGKCYLSNLMLRPGQNTIPIEANVDATVLAEIILKNGERWILPVDIAASEGSSVYDGQVIPYFSKAIAANNLTVQVDLKKTLGDTFWDLVKGVL
ncbi:hypothetical protein BDV23DRAFT_168063 [Aspergillus alliaceus]|uniref:Uncharacterized protein n=1 Tax=Petromyces alliaceus TaxID=209559 RepID=A0A5N6G6E8_PETAA|nr:uncharacterized protein BDW43DRAFT_317961 [Aspergillus alliaceus]KAB8236103.1 hypothetical protein BDW43DRAFT_317961 [Aspergillus alliaceus]KAE8396192.1 hypothetical protein BDV23DRAFT_168063 [Aspergillus alliaceus]